VVIVDTGILVAAAFPEDRYHAECTEFLRDPGDDMAVSDVVVGEISHFFKRSPHQPRPEVAFLRWLAGGRVEPLAPVRADYERMSELVERYHDLPLGATDASIVALAERLGVTRIATVARRDFGVVRPRHVGAFDLVPAL
jgi:hypothetical protein